MPSVALDGERIWVRTEGVGDDVLLIAGLGDDAASWEAQVASLAREHRVTTFDHRGVGRSSSPPAPWHVGDLAADALGVMDALQIERAHVVGASLGAVVAQELAAAAPGRIRTLVLSGTWRRTDARLRALIDSWIEMAAESESLGELLAVLSLSVSSEGRQDERVITQWLDSARVPGSRSYAAARDAFVAAAGAARSYDAGERLGRITAPALLIVGSEDPVVPRSQTRAVAEALADAWVVVFQGCGHQPFQEHPQDFSRLLARFFRSGTVDPQPVRASGRARGLARPARRAAPA